MKEEEIGKFGKYRDDGGPAFPRSFIHVTEVQGLAHCGITKREWFAGMALANPVVMGLVGFDESDAIARRAYGIADEMIKGGLK